MIHRPSEYDEKVDVEKRIEKAGLAAYTMAVELRKVLEKKMIRASMFTRAIDQLEIVMTELQILVAKQREANGEKIIPY